MKISHTISMIPAAAIAFTLIAPVQAGVINSVLLGKYSLFKQTSATSVKLMTPTDPDAPFGFGASVWGDNDAATAALKPKPTIILPGNSKFVATYNLKPTLVLDEYGSSWDFGYVGEKVSDSEEWTSQTKSEMDAVFPNGNYVFKIEGKVVNLSLPRDVYPVAPKLVLLGGAWVNGSYRIASNRTLTINTGTYAEYGSHLNDELYLDMENRVTEDLIFDYYHVAKKWEVDNVRSSAKSYTRKIPANTLKKGTYKVSAAYTACVSRSTALPGALAFGCFVSGTEVKVTVVAP